MRVTKVGAMRICAICERSLLMGERAVRYAPEEGAELVDVCALCQETAVEHGWLKEGTPTTPIVPGDPCRPWASSEPRPGLIWLMSPIPLT